MTVKRPKGSGLLQSAGWVTVALLSLAFISGVGIGSWELLDPFGGDRDYRIAAVRAVFTAVAGAGGLVTLGLFTHRAWVQHRTYRDMSYDAEERRITELYVKAVDQLGSAQPAVRLGGLYALDRLGRNHPAHRQEVADIFCAYLRRYFTPPSPYFPEADDAVAEPADRYLQDDVSDDAHDRERQDELEVRLTAQRLLIGHLKDPRPERRRNGRLSADERFWDVRRLDFTGASLVDADFSDCRLPEVDFSVVDFFGITTFDRARFWGEARFSAVDFHGSVGFRARFDGDVAFANVTFMKGAWFLDTRFTGAVEFEDITFAAAVSFHGVRFDREPAISNVVVTDLAEDSDWPPGWTLEPVGDGTARLKGISEPSEPDD